MRAARVKITTFISCVVIMAFASYPAAAQNPAAKPEPKKASLTLEDLFSEPTVVDADISPSGKYIAAIVRKDADDAIVQLDLTTGQKKLVTRINKDAFGKQLDVRLGFVLWKTDDRLLFQVQSRANEGLDISRLGRDTILKYGNRLFAINRDGTKLVSMIGEKYNDALVGAFDTSDVASMLAKDPQHILVRVGGWDGRSLFKVDVLDGTF